MIDTFVRPLNGLRPNNNTNILIGFRNACYIVENKVLYHEWFVDRFIFRTAILMWHPRHPDLTTFDHFHCEFLKVGVYVRYCTYRWLKNDFITTEILRWVMDYNLRKARLGIADWGQHLRDVLLHILVQRKSPVFMLLIFVLNRALKCVT